MDQVIFRSGFPIHGNCFETGIYRISNTNLKILPVIKKVILYEDVKGSR